MSETDVPWWLEVANDRPLSAFVHCPSPQHPANAGDADSVDVFCSADGTSLLGSLGSERALLKVAYVLRAIAVSAALAVGYFRIAWPAYVAGAVFAFAFALLFLRNHRAPMSYVATAAVFVTFGHWAWQSTGVVTLTSLLLGLALSLVVLEVCFCVAITLRAASESDEWREQFDVGVQTMLTAIIGVTIGLVGSMAAIFRYSPELVPDWLMWLAMHITPLAFSAAVLAILISSIAYTIHAPVFSFGDVMTAPEVLGVARFDRLEKPLPLTNPTSLEALANTVERVAIAFANGVTTAIESAYNRHIRGLVNGLVKLVVAVINACVRGAVKLARHVGRTTARFFVVAKFCARQGFAVAKRFTTAFALPLSLTWLACAELWWLASEFRAYIAGEVPWHTPILSLLRIALILVILATMIALVLQIPFSAFRIKLEIAATTIGANAFLFFVLVAWTLGIVGWLTNGPYKVGWVTLTSTGLIVCVLVAIRLRRNAQAIARVA
jgi:hypothetical protein